MSVKYEENHSGLSTSLVQAERTRFYLFEDETYQSRYFREFLFPYPRTEPRQKTYPLPFHRNLKGFGYK